MFGESSKVLVMMAGDHDHHPHTGDDARDGLSGLSYATFIHKIILTRG
jgi:hypothetical protein